ncbi:hypothetical protein MNEG_2522 [Monoraphidium neglectum]|uniref:Protein kinase domain-containing protein n=1 Tax=Monoraphidium neglectum TaxID=145388 RepID=A0A0D2LFP4_9CHLO|nr:hypothetical protein MNEG_2522 [Monoraphidium neglectum]KIZ05439.1 hypothetical protein MNEG_2522 [Monoraphidium neglectum]|eukprot:XP_013904458.1 hypothetical protein MNEG_2522 [Monoraphidium neglectum]
MDVDVAVKVRDFEPWEEAKALGSACRLGGLLPLLARSPSLLTTYRVELQKLRDGSFRLLQIMPICPKMLDALIAEAATRTEPGVIFHGSLGTACPLLQLPDLERPMPVGARNVKGTRAGCLLRPLSAGIPWREQRRVLTSVLKGLAGMHNAGLVMVDLKLHNIGLLDGLSQAVLLDFDTACILPSASGGAGSFVSVEGSSRETRAPELDALALRPTAASDMFAFGIIVLQLVLVQREAMALREAVRVAHESADPVSALDNVLYRLRVPSLIKDFVLPCLHKDPTLRPSAPQLLDSLVALPDDDLMDEHLTAELGWGQEEEMLRCFVLQAAQREKDLADARAVNEEGGGGEATATRLLANMAELNERKNAAGRAKLDDLLDMAKEFSRRLL